MRWLGLVSIIAGVLVLAIALPSAVALVRPFRSPRARRWVQLPWEDEPYPPRQLRRKRWLLVAGWLMFGLSGLARGLLEVFGYRSDFGSWLVTAMTLLSAVLMLAMLLIRPQQG